MHLRPSHFTRNVMPNMLKGRSSSSNGVLVLILPNLIETPWLVCVQEARTLKTNNVLNGQWYGRGDILVIGSQVLFAPAGTTQLSPAAYQRFSPWQKHPASKTDQSLAAVTIPSTSDPEIGHSWSSHALHQQQSFPLLQYWKSCWSVQFIKFCNPISKLLQSLFEEGRGWTVLSHFQWNLWSSQACLWTNAIFLWTWTETWCTSDHYDRVLNYNIVEIVHILQCKIADCCGIAEIRAGY
jgi:hypothetical protein